VERVGFAMEGSKLIRYSFSVGYIIFMLKVLRSVILVVFQSVFHLEKYVHNFFYFLKIIFEISMLK
jgi:hypothetical protein